MHFQRNIIALLRDNFRRLILSPDIIHFPYSGCSKRFPSKMGLVTFIYSLKLDVKKDKKIIIQLWKNLDRQTDRQVDREIERQTDLAKFTKLFNRTGGPIKSLNSTTNYQRLCFSCKTNVSWKFLVNLTAKNFNKKIGDANKMVTI